MFRTQRLRSPPCTEYRSPNIRQILGECWKTCIEIFANIFTTLDLTRLYIGQIPEVVGISAVHSWLCYMRDVIVMCSCYRKITVWDHTEIGSVVLANGLHVSWIAEVERALTTQHMVSTALPSVLIRHTPAHLHVSIISSSSISIIANNHARSLQLSTAKANWKAWNKN